MSEVINFIVANASEIVNIVFALLAVAALIVKLTPTPKDDAILATAYKVAELLASVLGRTKVVKSTNTEAKVAEAAAAQKAST